MKKIGVENITIKTYRINAEVWVCGENFTFNGDLAGLDDEDKRECIDDFLSEIAAEGYDLEEYAAKKIKVACAMAAGVDL